MNNFTIFKKVLLLFIGWRLALIILTFYASGILPVQDRTNNYYHKPTTNNYWAHWEQWDSAHILRVVDSGYIVNRTPFFPVYPLMIKATQFFGLNAFWGGFIIAQIATIGALFYFYKLVLEDFSEDIANKAVTLLLIFPTSFFLGAVYSESVFLFFSIAAFYYARRKSWYPAAVMAGLCAGTRLIGVAVIFSVLAEYFFTKVPQFKTEFLYNTFLKRLAILSFTAKLGIDLLLRVKVFGEGFVAGVFASLSEYTDGLLWAFLAGVILFYIFRYFDFKKLYSVNVLVLLISLIPLGLYMLYLYYLFDQPLAFFQGHENWGRHFTLPIYTVISHVRMMLPNPLTTGMVIQLQLELAAFILLSIFFIKSLYQLRFSYVTYFGLSMLFPLISGKLMSMPRIALVIFPMFILLAQIKNEAFNKYWIFASILFLAVLTIMYTNNFWVA